MVSCARGYRPLVLIHAFVTYIPSSTAADGHKTELEKGEPLTYEAAAAIAERDWRDGSSWERWDEIDHQRTGLAAHFRRAAAAPLVIFSHYYLEC